MYRNAPKLIFKIELLINNGLRVQLLMLDKFYNNSNKKKSFFSDEYFLIEQAGFYYVSKTRSLYLPKVLNKDDSVSLMFETEKERYEFLKTFNKSLLQWSKSNIWYGFNKPKTSRIVYNKNKWILY